MHKTPRWALVLGFVTLIVILVAVIMMVAGGGQHGPGRHTGGEPGVQRGVDESQTPPGFGGHTPPEGAHP